MRLIFFSVILLLLAGCNREPAVISPPKEAAAVAAPFLKQMAAGNKESASAYVANGAMDELQTQFAADHKRLAAAPALTPRYIDRIGDKIVLVYAAKKNDKWTSATLRLYRVGNEPFKIEYWRVANREPVPTMVASTDPKLVKMQQTMMYVMFGAMGLFGLIALGVLFWVIKRRPQLIVPEEVEETRANAVSVRDE